MGNVDSVSRVMMATQYVGTNGTDVLALVQGITQYSGNVWSVISDDATTVTLLEAGPTLSAVWTVTVGQWVVCDMSFGIIAILGADKYAVRYNQISTVVAEAIRDAGSIGVANVPALSAGIIAVPVQIKPAQADTSYVATASLSASASVLGSLSIDSVVKTSGSVVTVTVRNSGLLTLSGAIVIVNTTAPLPLR